MYILLLLSWFIAPPNGFAPTQTTAVVKWITEVDHDFGSLRKGDTGRFVFQFQNALDEPIVLETVRTTCGCTAADWPEAPIEPGATGEVIIDFDADRIGDFRKKITVFFNKQRKAETLWISGEVY